MRGIYVALALFATACFQSPEGRATAACSTICACEQPPVRSIQDQCLVGCVSDLAPTVDQITDECLGCISSHANKCSTVELDCEPICNFDQVDPPPPPDDEPPVIVDAGVVDAM